MSQTTLDKEPVLLEIDDPRKLAHAWSGNERKLWTAGLLDKIVAKCGYVKQSRRPFSPTESTGPRCPACIDVIVGKYSQDLHRL